MVERPVFFFLFAWPVYILPRLVCGVIFFFFFLRFFAPVPTTPLKFFPHSPHYFARVSVQSLTLVTIFSWSLAFLIPKVVGMVGPEWHASLFPPYLQTLFFAPPHFFFYILIFFFLVFPFVVLYFHFFSKVIFWGSRYCFFANTPPPF